MLRLVLQNPHGVLRQNIENSGKREGLMDLGHLQQLADLGADIVSLPESNINWRNEWARKGWKNVVKCLFTKSSVFFSSIKEEDEQGVFNQGGVCLIVNG